MRETRTTSILIAALCAALLALGARPAAAEPAAFRSLGREIPLVQSATWITLQLAPGAPADLVAQRVARLPGLAPRPFAARAPDALLLRLAPAPPGAGALGAALAALRSTPGVAHAAPALVTPDGRPLGLTPRAVILLDRGAAPAPIAAAVAARGGAVLRALPFVDGLLVALPSPDDALPFCAEARRVPGVLDAHPDFLREKVARAVPTDPHFDAQWYAAKACLSPALEATRGSAGVTIAVIDDGFDLEHEDLGGAARRSPDAFDFLGADGDPSAEGLDDHGTAVAGIALATGDNGRGIVGFCPRCRFLPIRRGATDSDDIAAIGHAAGAGAHVINCSWGYAYPSAGVTEAIARAAELGRGGLGSAVVFAAGNDALDIDEVHDISASPGALAIAATGPDDAPLPESNRGRSIALAAPAGGQTTTDRTVGGFAVGPYAHDFGGTSGAAPVVSGLLGLIFSLDPELTAAEAAAIAFQSAIPVGGDHDAGGRSPTVGWGRVDASRAVALTLGEPLPDPADAPACLERAPAADPAGAAPGCAVAAGGYGAGAAGPLAALLVAALAAARRKCGRGSSGRKEDRKGAGGTQGTQREER